VSYIADITYQEIKGRSTYLAVSCARQEKSELYRQGGTKSTVCCVSKGWVHLPALQNSFAHKGLRSILLRVPREIVE